MVTTYQLGFLQGSNQNNEIHVQCWSFYEMQCNLNSQIVIYHFFSISCFPLQSQAHNIALIDRYPHQKQNKQKTSSLL